MAKFGSDPSYTSNNLSATQDPNGNPIISPENGFGGSPLGIAARTQALYGLPNGHFDLTTPDPNLPVEVDNQIPYWSLEYSGTITTTMVYNATTQNWSVRMDPTGAASGDYAILKSRAYLLNDDALALRQKAYASLTKVGTTGTAAWSIVLSATYYDQSGAELSTYNIGTAADTGTWTGISGVTTSGSAAISASAAYADIALTLTAAAAVSGTAKVDISSVLLATSQATTGSFLVTQTFTSSGTFTRPTGVEYVSVVAVGGGGGGGCGGGFGASNTNQSATGGGGGGSSRWGYIPNLYIGDVSTVSVGVGAAGAGATITPRTKNVGGSAENVQPQYGTASSGGASSFGSYLSVPGGGAGSNGSGDQASAARNGGSGGTAGGAISCSIYGNDQLTAATGGAGGGNNIGGVATGASAGGSGGGSGITQLPFMIGVTSGSAGGSGTATADAGSQSGLQTSTKSGGASGNNRVSGGGGGGGAAGNAEPSTANPTSYTSSGAAAGMNGGGGGGGATMTRTARITGFTVAGGAGGNGGLYGGGGGGGGAGNISIDAAISEWTDSQGTFSGGAGGNGGSAIVIVSWVG